MIKLTLLTATTLSIFATVNDFHHALPTPAQIAEDSQLTETRQILKLLGRDLKFTEPVYYAAKANKIDPVLFAYLIETESEYKLTAKSKKGFVGLGQTPTAFMKQGYITADLALASCILRSKLDTEYANGDMLKAIQLYKGGKNPEALKYAKHVMKGYSKLKEQMKG